MKIIFYANGLPTNLQLPTNKGHASIQTRVRVQVLLFTIHNDKHIRQIIRANSNTHVWSHIGWGETNQIVPVWGSRPIVRDRWMKRNIIRPTSIRDRSSNSVSSVLFKKKWSCCATRCRTRYVDSIIITHGRETEGYLLFVDNIGFYHFVSNVVLVDMFGMLESSIQCFAHSKSVSVYTWLRASHGVIFAKLF